MGKELGESPPGPPPSQSCPDRNALIPPFSTPPRPPPRPPVGCVARALPPRLWAQWVAWPGPHSHPGCEELAEGAGGDSPGAGCGEPGEGRAGPGEEISTGPRLPDTHPRKPDSLGEGAREGRASKACAEAGARRGRGARTHEGACPDPGARAVFPEAGEGTSPCPHLGNLGALWR